MAECTTQFCDGIARDGVSTASAVGSAVLDLVGPASSVLDLGCGVGAGLVDQTDSSSFDLSLPFPVERSFGLGISTEVAEHLPETAADASVDALTLAAPCVLFSAPIPGHGGTRPHQRTSGRTAGPRSSPPAAR